MVDFYEILGVSPRAEKDVLRAAYNALIRKYHPDFNRPPDAQAKTQAINEAYATLSDPERRKAYDAQLKAQRSGDSSAGSPSSKETTSRARAASYSEVRNVEIIQRFLAKHIDIFLFQCVIIYAFYHTDIGSNLREKIIGTDLSGIIILLILLPLSLLIDSIFQNFMYDTYEKPISIGKLISGLDLTVEDRSFNVEFFVERNMRIFLYGLGLGIPILNLATMFNQYVYLKNNGFTSWDEVMGVNTVYKNVDWGRVAISASVLFWIMFVYYILLEPIGGF